MKRRRNVAYVVEGTESAQFRYRVKNVVEALEESNKWTGEIFVKSDIGKINLDEVDLLVILRQTAKKREVLQLIRRAHENGIKVLFDLDDLIFDYRDLKLIIETVREKNILYWMGYIWGIRRIAKKVDGFLCTNEFLAEKLKRSFGKPVQIIRNSLNRRQVEESEKYTRKKEVQKAKDEGFIVGYFSGSPTHARDLAMVESELLKFLDKYDDVTLRVVGDMEFSEKMKRYIERGRVVTSEKVSYLQLQKQIAEVDVNIVPLVVNDFTNCKSELKFFEAAAVETTTIASPTYAYKHAIKDGENGYLAGSDEWCTKLEYLYKDRRENHKIASVARKDALNRYYGATFLNEVEEAYDYFAR